MPGKKLAFIIALGLGACSHNNPGNDPGGATPKFTSKEQQTLQPFASCSAFKDYATEALTLEYTTGYWAGAPCWSCEIALDSVGAPARATLDAPPPGSELDATNSPDPAPAAGAGGEVRVNDTNTQEQGVDEADRVESTADGSIMYFLDNAWYGGSPQVLVFDTRIPATRPPPQSLRESPWIISAMHPESISTNPTTRSWSLTRAATIFRWHRMPHLRLSPVAVRAMGLLYRPSTSATRRPR